MKKLAELLASLEKSSLIRPENARILARGQNPLSKPVFVRVYPSLKLKRRYRLKTLNLLNRTASQNPKLGEK